MLTLGPIAFTQPWLLAALAALPGLWWLLRTAPPAPRTIRFPAILLLLGLRHAETTAARAPIWLLALRASIAAVAIAAFAHPIVNPAARFPGIGPLLLAIDDGWTAARGWAERQNAIQRLIDQAEREDRPVLVLTTAPGEDGRQVPPRLLRPGEARALARSLTPKPWPENRKAAFDLLNKDQLQRVTAAIWVSDGIEDGEARGFAENLHRLGGLHVLMPGAPALARLALKPELRGGDFVLRLARATPEASANAPDRAAVHASDDAGRVLARVELPFPADAAIAEAKLSVPAALRNRIARLVIDGEESAGGVVLLDDSWRRRDIGLATEGVPGAMGNLLDPAYYVEKAMMPYGTVRRGPVGALIKAGVDAIVLTDTGQVSSETAKALLAWIERGGVLVRFAGPRLAEAAGEGGREGARENRGGARDPLLPVALRQGGRALGGVMSWSTAQTLTPFEAQSPFAGLDLPKDIRINRLILAEPTPDLNARTWARLTDGTPLVTAAARARGWIVLMHTTADPSWSDLPLSGLFGEMLRRVVNLAGSGGAPRMAEALAPDAILDGFGQLHAPAGPVHPIEGPIEKAVLGPAHPPGYYGPAEARRALNVADRVTRLSAIDALPDGVAKSGFSGRREIDLRRFLLLVAIVLVAFDFFAGLWARGALRGHGGFGAGISGRLGRTLRRAPDGWRKGGAILVALLLTATPAAAQSDKSVANKSPSEKAVQAALVTRLAYVATGNPETDRMSRLGLGGLTRILNHRTATELGEPMAVNPESDELILFPLLYWPVGPDQRLPNATARARLNQYLRTGGMILFDTQAAAPGTQAAAARAGRMNAILGALDIQRLDPIAKDHVLLRAFYLLADWPGRWTGAPLYIEAQNDPARDGVASVVVGSHDWAGAWATDADGKPLLPVSPGGERQRELAYRFGVNMMMYALTGNYKADQVHVSAILERLGK